MNGVELVPAGCEQRRSFGSDDAWVTFVMPVYNGMPYIREALASVLAQQGPPWLLLIVDDGSVDGTWEYVQTLVGERIRAVRNTRNMGLYGTLNSILDGVTTPYTCIMFQDDRLHGDYLSRMYALATEYPDVSLLWTGTNDIDADGRVCRAGVKSDRFELISPGAAPWRGALIRGNYWVITGSLSKTSALRQYRFRADLPHAGDYEFLARVVVHEAFGYYEGPLCDLRIHAGAASTGNLDSLRDCSEILRMVSEQLKSHADFVSWAFRARLSLRLAKTISFRGLGAARQGKWKKAMRAAKLLPLIIPTCLIAQRNRRHNLSRPHGV